MQLKGTAELGAICGTASAMISSIGSDELLHVIVENARKVSGAKYVTLSFFDEMRMAVRIVAIAKSNPDEFDKLTDVLKTEDVFKQEFRVNKSTSFKNFLRKKQKRAIVLDSFHDFVFGAFDKQTCSLIEKITGVKEIVVIPLLLGDKLEGIIGFLYSTAEKRDLSLLLLFADFALQALEKSKVFSQLQEVKSNLQAIFETAGTTMLIVDEDKTISMVNKKIENLIGYAREEVEGKSWTRFVAKEDLKRLEEYRRLRWKDPQATPDSYEFRLVDKLGNIKHVISNVSVIPGTRKVVASLMDITESKRSKEEHMWHALVEMWSETLNAEMIRAFNVRILPEEFGLPQVLEQMANLSVVPSPSVLFDMTIQGARRILADKGINASDEQIRQVFTNPLLRFLRGVFVIARQFQREIPKEYMDFESELKGLEF